MKVELAKDCPLNVNEDSCPNCESDDCPIDRNIQRIMGMPKAHRDNLKKFLLQKIDQASNESQSTPEAKP